MAQRLALLIGNNEYDDASLAKLVAPPTDVTDLGELLRAPEIGGFTSVETLLNQSSAAARRAIARFFTGTKRDDLLLLYFSGHGILDDQGHLYLAVKDTERDLLSATAVEASFISSVMDRSLSRTQILMLDCCHSGAFGRTKGSLGSSVGTASLFEGKGFGRVVLTASDATQYAWDGDQLLGGASNSVFTRYLINGLRTGEADADSDGIITLDELYDYVYEKVITETPNQTPAKWSFRQQGNIILARNPSPVIHPVALPPELQSAIDSPFAGVREGTVGELGRMLLSSDRGLALSARLALEKLLTDDSRRVSTAAQAALDRVKGTPVEAPQASLAASPTAPLTESPPAPQPLAPSRGAEISPADTRQRQSAFAVAIKNPFVVTAAGWGISWLASLALGQITGNFIGLLLAWLFVGFIVGGYLARDQRSGRWVIAALLAACWGVPFIFLISLGIVLDFFGRAPSLEVFIPSYIFIAFALVGIGSSLVIQYLQRNTSSIDLDRDSQ